jgi:membrane-associated phospholipid phosphatase
VRRRAPGLAVVVAALAAAAAALAPARASAQTAPTLAPPSVSWARDGAITGAALLGAGLAGLIPVDEKALWQTQLLPIDDRLKGRASVVAARTSDVIAAVDVVTPLGLLIGQGGGFNEANDKRLLVYVEAVSLSVFVNNVTKHLVGRPRPYVYSDDPHVQEFVESQGKDSRLSFYSGHASTTFAASVAGSYLYAQYATDKKSRAAVWGFELGLAAATADLRTRAGSHFYSDVIVGALLGAGFGYLVPALHGGPAYHPSAAELAVIAAAPVAGVFIAELLPAKPTMVVKLGTVALPWVAPGGGGIVLARRF